MSYSHGLVTCSVVPAAPNITVESASHSHFDLQCPSTGMYIYLVQPSNLCLDLLELEVVGRRQGCTQCAAGKYEDQTGSTACKTCAWSWDANLPSRTVSEDFQSLAATESCSCNVGMTGSAGGFYQDLEAHRPTVQALDGSFSVVFDRTQTQFLHAALLTSGSTDDIFNRPDDMNLHPPKAFNVATAGGLTIVVRVKFTGSAGFEEKLIDFGNAKNATADSIKLGRYQGSGRIIAILADGAASHCELLSDEGIIVQNEWMTITFQYEASTNTAILKKNFDIISGPVTCTNTPSDRNVTRMMIGKGNSNSDDFLNGEIFRIYVADDIIRNLARACSLHIRANQSSEASPACLTLQSTTWTPVVGTQTYRDQMVSSVGGVEGCADLAVDGEVETCSQSWRETEPWWRVDLEVPRLVVSVRVHGRIDCCREELDGFRIYVGNWQSWDRNLPCAVNITAPRDQGWVDVLCQAEGRFVFIVLPGTNRSLALCEVEVHGLSNSASTAVSGILPNCTSCLPGLSFSRAPLHASSWIFLPATHAGLT